LFFYYIAIAVCDDIALEQIGIERQLKGDD